MKSEIYNALAGLNRGFDMVLESLKILHEEGAVAEEFVNDNSTIMQELWSGVNWMILHRLNAREGEDRDHYGILRSKIEEKRKRKATVTATGGDSGTDINRENGQRAQDAGESTERRGAEEEAKQKENRDRGRKHGKEHIYATTD